MKVILKDSEKIKEVKAGYAFNYLLPRGLALLATEENLRKWEKEKKKLQLEREKKEKIATSTISRLKGKKITFRLEGNKETGKLFKALTTKVLAEELQVDKKSIKLKQPIKKEGKYQIEVKVGSQKTKVEVEVKIK